MTLHTKILKMMIVWGHTGFGFTSSTVPAASSQPALDLLPGSGLWSLRRLNSSHFSTRSLGYRVRLRSFRRVFAKPPKAEATIFWSIDDCRIRLE